MTGTVHANNKLPNGSPAVGSVVITVNTDKQVIRDPAGNVVFQGPLTVKLLNGESTVTLPASDDLTLEPHGFTYTATEQLSHVSKGDYRSVEFQVVNGAVQHLADFASTGEVALDPSYGASLNGVLSSIQALRSGSDAAFNAALAASNAALLADGITYNSDGTVATSTSGGITTTYTYNPDGSVKTESRLGKTKTWSYDASGNPTGSAVV